MIETHVPKKLASKGHSFPSNRLPAGPRQILFFCPFNSPNSIAEIAASIRSARIGITGFASRRCLGVRMNFSHERTDFMGRFMGGFWKGSLLRMQP